MAEIPTSTVTVTDAVNVFDPNRRHVVRAAPLSWLNNFFQCMDNHIMNDAMLDEYQKIVFMFEQELLDRGLRHEFLDRMMTLHVLPHGSTQTSRNPCSDIRGDSQCSSPLPRNSANLPFIPTTSSSATITTMVESQSTHFDKLTSNMRRISTHLEYDANVSQSSTQSNSINYSFQQDPYYIALSSASAKLTQMQDDLHSALKMADIAAPQIPTNARQQIFQGLYHSVCDELNNLAKSCTMTSQSNQFSGNPTVSRNMYPIFATGTPVMCSMPNPSTSSSQKPNLPYSVCNPMPNYANIGHNVVYPNPNPNLANPTPINPNFVNPNVLNPSIFATVNSNPCYLPNNSNLSSNQPFIVNPMYPNSPQYNAVQNVNFDKLIPKFTTPYYLWAAQVRKLLYSRGINDLRNPNYMSLIGSAIINRLPSNAALAAPTIDVESLLQFLEGYDRHRRDVFEVMGKDGKFQNKPSIHYFLKCAEIRQADTANLTDQQIQTLAWQSMQKLFPPDLKSYVAMVSQGNRMPSQDQWETIDKMWSEAIAQRKSDNNRITSTAITQPTQTTEVDPVNKLTTQLEKVINNFTKQFNQNNTSSSGNKSKSKAKYGGSNLNKQKNKSSVGNQSSDNNDNQFNKTPTVGVTLPGRGVDMKKYYYARYPDRKDLCFYHQVFGPLSNRCAKNGCKWLDNKQNLLNKNNSESSTSKNF